LQLFALLEGILGELDTQHAVRLVAQVHRIEGSPSSWRERCVAL
jgi:hypothetical protein